MLSNSFGLQANAKNYISINSLDDLSKIENLYDKKLLILGAGTNVILDNKYEMFVINENARARVDSVQVRRGAG